MCEVTTIIVAMDVGMKAQSPFANPSATIQNIVEAIDSRNMRSVEPRFVVMSPSAGLFRSPALAGHRDHRPPPTAWSGPGGSRFAGLLETQRFGGPGQGQPDRPVSTRCVRF